MDPIIQAIQSGAYGKGQCITVVQPDGSIRFTVYEDGEVFYFPKD